MSWSWRTKPRSIVKTIQWFPAFAALAGQNWDAAAPGLSRLGKTIHPVRRSYIYTAHREEDAWLSQIPPEAYLTGQQDIKETESNGRNDKTTYEFFGFGYVNGQGRICVTEVGQRIVQGVFDREDYLKQLLKLHVPNETYKRRGAGQSEGLFPMKLILQAFSAFDSLNRSELALLFGCDTADQTDSALQAVGAFKQAYEALPNKNNICAVKKLFEQVYTRYYGELKNRVDSYYDYAEGLTRSLLYTGLFTVSGRSIAAKVRVAQHSGTKVRMLLEQHLFVYPETFADIEDYMRWYGAAGNVALPWDRLAAQRQILLEKAALLREKLKSGAAAYGRAAALNLESLDEMAKAALSGEDIGVLKSCEARISDAITGYNEDYFVRTASKTAPERKAILDKFKDILRNEDMSALWLEVNTWKSLVALPGDHSVKRNFRIEEDLTPRSFAPGIGNTPDMELYGPDYILIPEVSLMTGVRQWEHEASSVIDHVLSFIRKNPQKPVLGLFISARIHTRTLWQFFVLNRESWVGTPVPVVPLTIEQYGALISGFYERRAESVDLWRLLAQIAGRASDCVDYRQWEQEISRLVAEPLVRPLPI